MVAFTSILAGMDMTMHYSRPFWGSHSEFLVEAVRNGLLAESRLTEMATRLVAAWYPDGQAPGYPPLAVGLPISFTAAHEPVQTEFAQLPESVSTCLRAILTSYVSQNWVIGQVIVSSVLRGVLDMEAPWAYRIPFAVQWFWPMAVVIAVFFAPESPWWLVRQHRLEEAKASLRRLTSGQDDDFDVDKTVTLMALTTEHERELNSRTSFVACFQGTDLRRTIIVIGCYCMQVISGTTPRSYATYFFQQAGLPTDQSFNMSIVTYALSFIGTLVAWFLMPHVGRRTLFLWGLNMLAVIYVVLGVPPSTSSLSWAIASLLLASAFIAYICMIPVIFAVVSEIPSSLLRSKSVAIARFSYAVINVVANVLTPYQLNPSAWGWGAKSGFFWGGSCILGLLFTYFVVPEPKDKTVAELDLLFKKKVSARKFTKTQVHVSEVATRAH
ncbi:uncharacterized protein Z518_11280 [Rhinocladiella mackenziei CBS 650.93]|uniref:Major facilitator superfamily (MFS) profile domain-containing protein n=1 Tax=Rhinocladiella mackenziei CBS 650.93 TaxID=1442369 RepID=A0A0D2FBS8_9EURO|nr:uncharacterized protein Z518_11280 [Rhinocladiella mackenziei CBS 650.93]KIW99541.1 hypothetical protein Z518_11280 [Rhinocladiella mackenziei CBS 650.93]